MKTAYFLTNAFDYFCISHFTFPIIYDKHLSSTFFRKFVETRLYSPTTRMAFVIVIRLDEFDLNAKLRIAQFRHVVNITCIIKFWIAFFK